MLLLGAFKVLQVLFERRLVELGQKLAAGSGIESTDVLDQLIFAHGGFTLKLEFAASYSYKSDNLHK